MSQQAGYFGIWYSDADEKQSPLETGEYGIYYDDNSDGTEVKRTFIDETGKPIFNALGYASIVQSFYLDGKIIQPNLIRSNMG